MHWSAILFISNATYKALWTATLHEMCYMNETLYDKDVVVLFGFLVVVSQLVLGEKHLDRCRPNYTWFSNDVGYKR